MALYLRQFVWNMGIIKRWRCSEVWERIFFFLKLFYKQCRRKWTREDFNWYHHSVMAKFLSCACSWVLALPLPSLFCILLFIFASCFLFLHLAFYFCNESRKSPIVTEKFSQLLPDNFMYHALYNFSVVKVKIQPTIILGFGTVTRAAQS